VIPKICAALVALIVMTSFSVITQEAIAKGTKSVTASGVVTSVSDGSLAIDASGKKAMTFIVDSSTHVIGSGAGTKTRAKRAAGASGAAVGDLVHVGDQVKVKYDNASGGMRANEIRVTVTQAAR
jgi:hypothetical protein